MRDWPGDDVFHVAADAGVAPALPASPCFLAGTRIRTPGGDVPVEALRIGDRVVTLRDAARRIKFLGRRAYRQPYPEQDVDIIPILICRNALGPDVPERDLFVSPLHAMLLGGALVPAGLLANGRSIRPCRNFAELQYIHIELESHDVIFAEGAPAETFPDGQSREIFANAEEHAALYPGEEVRAGRFCAPRLESGPGLKRIWRALAARAGLGAAPDAPAGARLDGFVDQAGHERIEGWAFLPDYPDEAVELEVLDGAGVIARVFADGYRADLAARRMGNGRHGFALNFATLLAPERPHVLRVRRAQGHAELQRSPMVLRPEPVARVRMPADGAARRRALVLDALWPDAARDAGSNAVLSHIFALRALGYEVELIATQALDHMPPEIAGVRCHAAQTVEAALRTNSYDLVYLHRLAVAGPYAGLARSLCPGAVILYSVADLHYRRLAGQARVEADVRLAAQVAAVRRQEIFAMRQADAVITHSDVEAGILRAECPGINLHVVPWDAAPAAAPAPFGRRHGMLFLGNASHAPNQDAVRFLLAEILPLVWQNLPGLRCAVVGFGWRGAAFPRLDERVRVVGAVADLRAMLRAARLSVAPLRYGAGLKGKVLESLAAGVPCAATPVAAEGFGLDAAMIAGDAEGLAALICRLHEEAGFNLAMAKAGLALVARDFNGAVVREGLRGAVARREFPALKAQKFFGSFFKNEPLPSSSGA